MSCYCSGDIIRLSRIACNMTQEELCENICELRTLSRIENGKHKVKREVYEQLMQRMNRYPHRMYAVFSGRQLELLEEREKLEASLRKHDFPQAKVHLRRFESKIGKNIVSRQYLGKQQAVVDYCSGRMKVTEFVEKLEKNIQLTIPDYRVYIKKTYPFTEQELDTLLSLAIAYKDRGEVSCGIQILEMMLRSLEKEYLDARSAMEWRILINCNRAKMLGMLGKHQEALTLCANNLEEAKKCQYEVFFPTILLEASWNLLELIKSGKRGESELEDCKAYLKLAFYLAQAGKKEKEKKIIKAFYLEEFHAEIDPETEIHFVH